uniref:hypothetical protein n=1 Tax=Parerythrobacter lutipelagi TaxID=1964208 RepID=UPI001957FBED|nr:hypothetical protein [Parerythrobacter lutipelagi]
MVISQRFFFATIVDDTRSKHKRNSAAEPLRIAIPFAIAAVQHYIAQSQIYAE